MLRCALHDRITGDVGQSLTEEGNSVGSLFRSMRLYMNPRIRTARTGVRALRQERQRRSVWVIINHPEYKKQNTVQRVLPTSFVGCGTSVPKGYP
jgi:hypothetical protein